MNAPLRLAAQNGRKLNPGRRVIKLLLTREDYAEIERRWSGSCWPYALWLGHPGVDVLCTTHLTQSVRLHADGKTTVLRLPRESAIQAADVPY